MNNPPKYFTFYADTINGEIFEKPQAVTLECNKILPKGQLLVRAFDANDCIVVRQVYVIQQGFDLFGTVNLKTLQDYVTYIDSVCNCCKEQQCGVQINECFFTINGCYATINGN